jgi:integrase
VSPAEASALLAVLPDADRAIWATAMYAGLRRGELQALRWEDIDFGRRLIRVQRSWDQIEGIIEPKSRAGIRTVPMLARLVPILEHAYTLNGGLGLAFGREADLAFSASAVHHRGKRAGLEPVGLHDCRHTYGSLLIPAGVNIKAVQVFMGHASITITLDRMGI